MADESVRVKKGTYVRADLLRRSYVPPDLRESLESADVILVPQDGFRDVEHPFFPVGTEELVAVLSEDLPEGFSFELPVSDGDYEELALHGALVVVGGFFVTAVAAPIFVNLVNKVLENRFPQYFGPGARRADAKLDVTIERPDGTTVSISYEGPVPDMLPTVSSVVGNLPGPEEIEVDALQIEAPRGDDD